MDKKIVLLGSTGSVGKQAADVARRMNLKVEALAAKGGNIRLFYEQCLEFKPKLAALYDKDKAEELKTMLSGENIKVVWADEGLIEAACAAPGGIVLTAMVGMIGLRPTIAAIEEGCDIALANKETLVCAGDLVMETARKKNVKILPVDSEHSAVFQCVDGKYEDIKKIILTASGGPFFGMKPEEIYNMGTRETLAHPTWKMGPKITVDCATLMNKGLEFIEAMRLFGVGYDKVDILVHRESVIHSMVEFRDNSVIAQLGEPDMRLPIQYAFTYPKRYEAVIPELDLAERGKLTFARPDYESFRCLKLALDAAKQGGSICTALNAANEVAVGYFLKDMIKFGNIAEIVEKVLEDTKYYKINTVDDALECDREARGKALAV